MHKLGEPNLIHRDDAQVQTKNLVFHVNFMLTCDHFLPMKAQPYTNNPANRACHELGLQACCYMYYCILDGCVVYFEYFGLFKMLYNVQNPESDHREGSYGCLREISRSSYKRTTHRENTGNSIIPLGL